MSSRYSTYVRAINFFCDIILVNVSYLLSWYFLYNQLTWKNGVLNTLIVFNVIWIFSSFVMRLYWFAKSPVEDIFRRTWRSVLLHAVLFMSFLFFSSISITAGFFVLAVFIMSALFILSRFILTYFHEFLLTRKPGKQIAIVGYNSTAKKLADYLQEQKGEYVFRGFFDDELSRNNSTVCSQRASIIGTIENCILYAREKRVEEIY